MSIITYTVLGIDTEVDRETLGFPTPRLSFPPPKESWIMYYLEHT